MKPDRANAGERRGGVVVPSSGLLATLVREAEQEERVMVELQRAVASGDREAVFNVARVLVGMGVPVPTENPSV